DVEYVHKFRSLCAGLRQYGRAFIEAAQWNVKTIASYDWEAHALRNAPSGPAVSSSETKDEGRNVQLNVRGASTSNSTSKQEDSTNVTNSGQHSSKVTTTSSSKVTTTATEGVDRVKIAAGTRTDGDPTRKALDEIYEQLNLNGEAQLIQCHKCKGWDVRYKTIQLRSLDEP